VTAVQYLLGLVVLAWILLRADLSAYGSYLAGIDRGVLAAILGLTVLEFGARFLTWHSLFRRFAPTTFGQAASVDLLIKFVNLFLPSRLSGRVLSPAVVRHYTDFSWGDAVGLSAVFTGLYALLYGGVAAVGLLVAAGSFSPGLLVVIGLSVGLYLLAGTSVLLAGTRMGWFDRLVSVVRRVVARVPSARVRTAILSRLDGAGDLSEESQAIFREVLAAPRTLGLFAIGWAGALFVIPGVRVWLLLQDGGVASPILPVVALLVVTAYSVTLLPVTPGGLGVAEASAVLVLASAGIPEAAATSVIVVDRLLGVYVPSLLGVVPASRMDLQGLLDRRGA